jgi:dihydropteroate synthase
MSKTFQLKWANHDLVLGHRTCIMGIVNVTPDSFSDGGKFFSNQAAVDHGVRLAAEGADIIDIGGESTRPFSEAVMETEEIRRVVPVIEALAARVNVPLSIDTTKAEVARRAIAAGASIVNDVGALRLDPGLGRVVADAGVPLILMHMLGQPRTMQVNPVYEDLVGEITSFLADAVSRAENSGVDRSRIIIDPGIGFGKNLRHNLELLRHLDAFKILDLPILIGVSRKAFIRKLLKKDDMPDLAADQPVVATGTQAAVAAAVLNGAHIVRVHDVAETRATLRVIDAICHPEIADVDEHP